MNGNAPAGWYPDAQNPAQLRYWDGSQWTDQVTPNPAIEQNQQAPAPQAPYTPQASYYQPSHGPAPVNVQVFGGQPQQGMGAQTQSPVYAQGRSATDEAMLLATFISTLVITSTVGISLIPLAWLIPMTVVSWRIYKGYRPNTIAFGVCLLIFAGIIPGIFSLVARHER